MIRLLVVMSFFSLSIAQIASAATEGVAKIIIIKGDVFAIGADKQKVKLSKNSWLQEGAILQTQAKSFAKLLFIDKSQMNLGPSSEMTISEFPENKAGIITLMKGELRSQVTKNYMDMEKGEKSKLYIKTKTAAMGVRGTEFHVSYNPENLKTALITLSGEVSFVQVNTDAIANTIDRSVLERAVSSSESVLVTKGQFSGSGPDLPRATVPVTISPAQFEVIKNNDGTKQEQETSEDQVKNAPVKKQFRSIVPPGMDAKTVANDGTGMEKALKGAGSGEGVARAQEVIAKNAPKLDGNAPPPEGSVNATTGAIAPTAGGFIDMKTAQYIPPPKGSSYDPATKTYVPPPSMGGFDAKTGTYKNDNFTLTSTGQFVSKVEVQPTAQTATKTASGTTSPTGAASAKTQQVAPPPPPKLSMIPQMDGANVVGDLANIAKMTDAMGSGTTDGRAPASVNDPNAAPGGTEGPLKADGDDPAFADFDSSALIDEVMNDRDDDLDQIQEEIVEQATKTPVTFTVQ